MAFATNLRLAMQQKHITSYRLAKEIGVHATTVANWLSGASPSAPKLKEVSTYLGVSVDELLEEQEEA